MSESCSPLCYNGGRISASSACICDQGYWNASCSAVCPGGADDPCSGFGTCDQTKGTCDCPLNRITSDDCSVCTSGWYGSDCSIAVNEENDNVTDHITAVGQLGMIYTLDGISYAVKTQGELLLLAISDNIIIQGKFVTCYQNYSCLSFLALRVGDSVNGFAVITTQAQRTYNAKPVVYIDGILDTVDKTLYFDGFQLYRANFFEVVLDITDLMTLRIRSEGQYLHFTTEIPQTLVTMTSGLLSGAQLQNTSDKLDHFYSASVPYFDICNDVSSTQETRSAESSATLSLTSYTQTYEYNTEFNITRFRFDQCDSFIYYPNDDYKDQTQGGYGLAFSKSSLSHAFSIDANITSELTIELMVKQKNPNNSGVLFSFTSDISLLIVGGESSLEIHTYNGDNQTVYDTNLVLDENYWNKVVFTYNNDDGSTTVYSFDKESAISTSGSFYLDTGLFNNSGFLTIGHWEAPSDSRMYNLPSGFEGSVENFMIWNAIVLDSEVSELWGMNPSVPSDILLFSLEFNEGDGPSTSDSISNTVVSFPMYPWKAPEWFISDIQYISTNNLDFTSMFYKNATWENEAYTLCASAIFSGVCQGMHNSTKGFFFIICRQVLSVTEDKSSGYNIILDMLLICESQHKMASSEITSFCSDLDENSKNGTSCTTNCLFGFEYSNGTCDCFNGYYGVSCDSVCPGTSDAPCTDHGVCQSDGSCKCWWNWGGSSDCSTCTSASEGSMMGPDCTILDTTSLSSGSYKRAAVSSNGYYMTFEGQQISFIGESGVFMLFYSSFLNVEIHVYQVSCHYGSCIAAISVASSTNNVVIAPAGQGYKPLIYLDGVLIDMDAKSSTYGTGPTLNIIQSSLTELSVTVTDIGSITVTILAQEQFLQAAISTASTVCQEGTGVFGNCSGGMDYASMTEREISEFIVSNFRMQDSVILSALDAPVTDASSITGYALSFNGTAATSKPIMYPTGFSLSEKDFSLSIYFKPMEYGGYLLSYGKDSNFGILNLDPIQIQYSTTFVSTSFTPELAIWNQLILTFRRNLKIIDLYHFGNSSRMAFETISLDCPDLFDSGGTIMLGEYTPSVNNAKYTYNSKPFTGIIDEFTVWKNAIPQNLIYQAHLLDTKVSDFTSELAVLLSFSEGVGTIAFEQVSGINMALPKSPWQSPLWILSDLSLQTLRTTLNERYTTVDIVPQVENICSAFFDSSAVTNECDDVSDFIKWWYKQTCMVTATNTGNISDTTMAMVDFTSVCGVIVGSTSNTYDVLCDLDINLPGWLSQKCSNCAFGYENNGACSCYYGYYGETCDAVCPGGVINPCNANGECDVDGNCQCNGHWTGLECNECDSDWTGDDCAIYSKSSHKPLESSSTLVAQVNLIGQLSAFDGTIFDVPHLGYFKLLDLTELNFKVFGRFSVCTSDTALHVCLVGCIIDHNGDHYYVSHEAYDTNSVEILTSTSSLKLFDTISIGSVTMKLLSPTTVQVTVDNSELVLNMSSISNRLLTTMSLPKAEWDSLHPNIGGVMTACDTSVAIIAANCNVSRESICSTPTQDIPDDCEMSQSKDAIKTFLNNDIFTDEAFISTIESIYVSPMGSNCFNYSGSGVSASGLSLPDSGFTLELQVQPLTTGGIILVYDYEGEYIVLVNHVDGLVIVLKDVYYTSDMPLQLNTWNQLSLAWRDDVDILEVYLADDAGK